MHRLFFHRRRQDNILEYLRKTQSIHTIPGEQLSSVIAIESYAHANIEFNLSLAFNRSNINLRALTETLAKGWGWRLNLAIIHYNRLQRRDEILWFIKKKKPGKVTNIEFNNAIDQLSKNTRECEPSYNECSHNVSLSDECKWPRLDSLHIRRYQREERKIFSRERWLETIFRESRKPLNHPTLSPDFFSIVLYFSCVKTESNAG